MFFRFKLAQIYSSLLFVFLFSGCNSTSYEPERLYESKDRYSNDFSFSPSINKIVVTNPIGFTFLYGSTDTARVTFVLDREVKAKTKSLAQSELQKIGLEHYISNDTLFCNVTSPSDLNNIYEGNLSLNVHYRKSAVIKNPNKGIYAAYFNADLEIETNAWETTVEQHDGSLKVHSVDGNITATIAIPHKGFCKCYTESGNINVRIPLITSANVILRTSTGSITYSNLNLLVNTISNQELTGVLATGEGDIFLESDEGRVVLEGF